VITIEPDLTKDEHGRLQHWWRWVCTCEAAGSWLHDHAKVERMAAAHALAHVAAEVRP